jgi:SAM-dependent methyltransferase
MRVLNWLLRYQPVLDVLAADRATTALDVGSGWYGLSWYWPHTVVQTDLEFSGARPTERRPGLPQFVRSTAERLPFADGAFDHVVSLDMVEHLPSSIREASVRELTRVARRAVVVAFPCGSRAQRVDRALAAGLRATPRRVVPPWLSEHLGQADYPDDELVARSLPDGWHVAATRDVGNAVLQGLVVYAEELPGINRATRVLERRLRDRPVPAFMDRGRTYRRMYVLRPRG